MTFGGPRPSARKAQNAKSGSRTSWGKILLMLLTTDAVITTCFGYNCSGTRRKWCLVVVVVLLLLRRLLLLLLLPLLLEALEVIEVEEV